MISERTAFLVIVTMALLVALVAAPTAAREILDSGNTVYVGEEDIAFAGAFGAGPVTQIVHYSDPSAGAIDKTIQADAAGNVTELTKTAIGTTTGPYYVFDAAGDPTDRVTALGYINVQNPQATLGVVLSANTLDSVDGKSVTRTSDVAFKLTNNLNGLAGTGAAMNIEVILPGGGVTTQFGNQVLSGIAVNGTTALVNPVNLSTAAAGTYTAIAKWPGTSDFYGKGFDSNAVTFEVLTKSLAITSNKDSVVHGNSFIVTITGESVQDYRLFIKPDTTLANTEYPFAVAGQNGVTPGAADASRNMTVKTNAAGTRSVQFNTNQSTGDWIFTIRVEDPASPGIYDEVRVRVERGAVTIAASGTGVYYLGEEITLSGTNTDNDVVYLFLTGPNLPINGVRLLDVTAPVENGDPATFTRVYVEADDTWSYKWNTADVGRHLDVGSYTIYAAAQPQGKGNLTDVRFATTSIVLRVPSLTVQPSGTHLTPGDDCRISGTATGAPTAVQVWILGPDCYHSGAATVESDGTFDYVLAGADTSALTEGRYYVIVQHPGCNGFDVWVSNPDPLAISGNGICPMVLGNLQAPEAANALINALDSPNVDDIYAKFSFTIPEVFWIQIDGLSDQTYGETFTVTGTTNCPSGMMLAYWIAAAEGGAIVLSGEAAVTDGGGWNFTEDTTALGPGAFTLHVTAPDGQASAIALFDVYDDVIHPVPPGGGSYRVERIGTVPSLDSLFAGEGVALDGIIRLDDTLGYLHSPLASRTLEFSTDLLNPAWSYNLRVDSNLLYTSPLAVNSRSFTLSGWDLDYQGDVRVLLHLSGTVPETAGTRDSALLRILEREGDGRVVPNSEHLLSLPLTGSDPAPSSTDNLTLSPDWNFVSIPRSLAAGNDTTAIFAGVDVDGHSAFRYDTANRNWIALMPTDQIRPLEGFWIYSTGSATIPLNFSTDPLVSPMERSLSTGWNAVGVTGSTPATARDTFHSVNGQWSTLIGFNVQTQAFETGIVNSGSGANADTRSVYPGRGYWLSMTGPGTLYALGA